MNTSLSAISKIKSPSRACTRVVPSKRANNPAIPEELPHTSVGKMKIINSHRDSPAKHSLLAVWQMEYDETRMKYPGAARFRVRIVAGGRPCSSGARRRVIKVGPALARLMKANRQAAGFRDYRARAALARSLLPIELSSGLIAQGSRARAPRFKAERALARDHREIAPT